jgi:hypothetical protein
VFGGKKKLYAEGAQTDGVVLKQASANDRIHFRVVVRAKLSDGSTTEFHSQFLDVHDVGSLYQGSVVPVRYDPSDHSKIALDLPALKSTHAQAEAAQQAQLAAQVAHLEEPGPQHAGGPAAQVLEGLGGGDLKAQLLQMAAQNPESVIDLRSSQSPAEHASQDPVERLSKLAELKQQGALTEEEFAAAKAQILGDS